MPPGGEHGHSLYSLIVNRFHLAPSRHLMCVFSVLTYVETQLGDRLSEESDQFLQHAAVTSSALSVLFPLFGLGW